MDRLTNADWKETGVVGYNGPKNPFSKTVTVGELVLGTIPQAREILRDIFRQCAELEDDACIPAISRDPLRAGQLVFYINGDCCEVGKVKRVNNDGTAFVWYHAGSTAARTPVELLRPIRNDSIIAATLHNTADANYVAVAPILDVISRLEKVSDCREDEAHMNGRADDSTFLIDQAALNSAIAILRGMVDGLPLDRNAREDIDFRKASAAFFNTKLGQAPGREVET